MLLLSMCDFEWNEELEPNQRAFFIIDWENACLDTLLLTRGFYCIQTSHSRLVTSLHNVTWVWMGIMVDAQGAELALESVGLPKLLKLDLWLNGV